MWVTESSRMTDGTQADKGNHSPPLLVKVLFAQTINFLAIFKDK